jgi:hypothetical protein
VAGFQGVKDRLYSFYISVTMFFRDTVQLGLEFRRIGLLLVKCDVAGARISLEILHVELNLLSGELLLVSLELEEFLAVDRCSLRTPSPPVAPPTDSEIPERWA